MPDSTMNSVHEKLGELVGKLGEMNHNLNNTAAKVDTISEKVTVALELIRRVDDLEREDRAKGLRLAVLEADKHRREGAIGLLAWISRNWPVAVVISIGAAITAWANGVLHR